MKKNVIYMVWQHRDTKELFCFRYSKPHTANEVISYFKRYHAKRPFYEYELTEVEII